ncbi:SanA/YdcF family protein [Winogradskyella sp. UBA3174]|uniref:SanA/YdcF family protein n=1 Tax=Winogradskyella sp. UBA3174 TaxID=1947785 RepID=UPI0025E6A27A|nr:ElyC/SanA/YdcF family protein [Winogradskyella sp. UBA3174]|tara:strand:+ start:54713 stop:55336 length:624 start_codon:yes stop_codon:yes gene_type:complete
MKKLKILILIFVFITLGVFITHHWMSFKSKDYIYSDTDSIPKNKVGLVLGTGKYAPSGNIKQYYKYRVNAAVDLYKAQKIDYLLISGDNSRTDYDEPTDFKNDLIARGIPEAKIFLDYAGFRTLDSMVRAKEIFGQTSITVISQKFHNERAIYLASHFNINAIGFNAKDPIRGKITHLREYLARSKASLDLVFNVSPKFLGEPISIP